MGVTLGVCGATDATGWTSFTKSLPTGEGTGFSGAGTREVFVSSSTGNDTTGDGSSATPFATIYKGCQSIRTGHADWLRLKKGDTWTLSWNGDRFDTASYPGVFNKAGVSATEPMRICSYGTGARPLLNCNMEYPDQTGAFSVIGMPGNSPQYIGADYLAITGLEFYHYRKDPANGSYDSAAWVAGSINFQEITNWWLVENCKFSYGGSAVDMGGGANNLDGVTHQVVKIRRNVSSFSYARTDINGFASGFHAENYGDLLYEENISYHDGWLNLGDPNIVVGPRTIYYHSFYIQVNPSMVSCVSRDNLAILGSWGGIQQRQGGTIKNNYIDKCGIGIVCQHGNTDVDDNVLLHMQGAEGQTGFTWDPGRPGWGIILYMPVESGVVKRARRNLIANVEAPNDVEPLLFSDGLGSAATTGGSTLNNVIYNFVKGINTSTVTGVTQVGDIVETGSSNTHGFLAPTRDILAYDSAVLSGAGTLASVSAKLLAQSQDAWDTRLMATPLNDWVRAGWNMAALGTTTGVTTYIRLGALGFRLHS